jgi:threonine dehydrogenase-like Zn-dependent dehydrogenase
VGWDAPETETLSWWGRATKVVTTNICGSDQHMVRGRTSLPGGHMVLGHEITGEVVEVGNDVEYIKKGDLCSVPFNIACGRCAACKRGDTGICLNVNPARPGAAYGCVPLSTRVSTHWGEEPVHRSIDTGTHAGTWIWEAGSAARRST